MAFYYRIASSANRGSHRFVLSGLLAYPRFVADIEAQFEPVFTMYSMIDRYLPSNVTLIDKDEQDQRLLLRSSWSKLIDEAQEAQANLQKMQSTYKRELILNINTLKADSKQFREDFVKNGPACPGIMPRLAVAYDSFIRSLVACIYIYIYATLHARHYTHGQL